MTREQSSYPAATLARNRGFRCFIQALFTAGVLVPLVNFLDLVEPGKQPYLFFLVLFVAFIGAQIQERMRRLSS